MCFGQKSIGQQHNEDIVAITNLLKLTGSETQSKIKDEVVQALIKYYDTESTFVGFFSKANDPYELLDQLKGKMSNELYSLVKTDLEFARLNTLQSLTSRLNAQNTDKLSTQEKTAYNNFKSIIISSTELWQSDEGTRIIGVLNPPLVAQNKGWFGNINGWKVLGCDAVRGLGGFLLGGPKGALVGGVVASACSAINQY